MSDLKDDKQPELDVTLEEKDVTLDEQPELPLDTAPAETKPVEPEKPAVDPVEEMRAQLEAAQRRAADLQAERDRIASIAVQREREAAAAQGNVLLAQYNEIVGSINSARAEQARLKRELQEAFETGDAVRHADINAKLAELTVDLRDMDEGRIRIEREAERRRQTAQQPRQTPQNDPREAVRRELERLTPPSQQWVLKNLQTWMDPAKKEKIIQLDAVAKYNGIQPDTPAYFTFIEEKMGLRPPSSDARQTARPTNYAAPVSRDGGGPTRPSQVRLTAAERQMAADLGMSDVEYAKNKLEAAQQPWSVHRKGA